MSAICMSSLKKCQFRSSAHFWLGCSVFWLLSCNFSHLYILEIKPFSITHWQIFFSKSIYIVLIIYYSKIAIFPCHCIDYYEAYDLYNIKIRVPCQWKNQIKMSAIWNQTVNCYFTFNEKIAFQPIGSRAKLPLAKICTAKILDVSPFLL